MSTRTYGEFKKRMQAILARPVPCPECGCDLPATDDDTRRAHFKVCPGKPKPAVPANVLNIPDRTTDELRGMVLNLRTRIAFHQNPGGSYLMARVLSDVLEAAKSELASREGAQ